jgi:phosphomannomutase
MTAPALIFGTAGLRAIMGPGADQFNIRLVEQVTAAMCRHLLTAVPNAASRGVCVGFDARHHSQDFAQAVCEVLAAHHIRAWRFERAVPTPLLAFAVTHRQAAAGVMITASHNPPQYNGYKLYWDNGAQVIPPHDAAIMADLTTGPTDITRMPVPEAAASGRITNIDDSIQAAYLSYIQHLLPSPRATAKIRVGYTPLHGVGGTVFAAALAGTGFAPAITVPEQSLADPDFPTTPFPNPEEPGAMDRLLALAKAHQVDLALAHDPDADRLAVAAPDISGHWHTLSGNDVGALLCDYLLERTDPHPKRLVLSTVVSSPLIGRIAQAHGAHWEQTLTGFKWLMNRAQQMTAQGYRFVFAYEEALGYAVDATVADKDGISAAILMTELSSKLADERQNIHQALHALWRRHGLYQSALESIALVGDAALSTMNDKLERLRQQPPQSWSGIPVCEVLDYQAGMKRRPDGTSVSLQLPPSNVIGLELEGGHRVMLRPSGTEPKLKIYADVCEPLNADDDVVEAKARAVAQAASLVEWTRQHIAQ